MDASNIYRSEYFLPTQGMDAARAQVDLQRVFGRPGQVCSIEERNIHGRSGLYVRASLNLSREQIRGLAGRTPSHLERLLKIETRLVSAEPDFSAPSAQPPAAGPQPDSSSTIGFSHQSPYAHPSMPTPASFHRRESDAGDRRLVAGTPRSLHNRPEHLPQGQAANISSYSASQYYRDNSPEREQNEGSSPFGQRAISRNEPQREAEDVSPDAATYDARNDAFFFPPNSVSAEEIQRRRDMLRGTRGAFGR